MRMPAAGLHALHDRTAAACDMKLHGSFRPGGLICDWGAAVNIHIHFQTRLQSKDLYVPQNDLSYRPCYLRFTLMSGRTRICFSGY